MAIELKHIYLKKGVYSVVHPWSELSYDSSVSPPILMRIPKTSLKQQFMLSFSLKPSLSYIYKCALNT